MRRVARIEQVALRGAAQRPVHVLARAVDAGERLFVRQARHAVLLGHALERDHDQLLVIVRQVGRLEHRGDFVLGRGHFVVARLHRDAQLEQLALDFQHEGQHALGNRAEVVIFELLALRRLRAEQRAAGRQQVGPREEEVAVDQEVFLLGTGRRRDERAVRLAEQLQHALGLLVERLHRTQQRRLLVERFAGPGDERRGNAQRRAVRVFQNVGRAGDVPDRVAAGFERGADAAGREARAVGLALDQLLAGELGHRAAVAIGREEAVVLFGGEAGEREEDVGVVRRALFDGPILHGRGDDVGNRRVELLARFDRLAKCLVDRLRQPVLHHRLVEDVAAEELGCRRVDEIERLGDWLVIGDGRDGGHPRRTARETIAASGCRRTAMRRGLCRPNEL